MFGKAAPVASLHVTPPPDDDAYEDMDLAGFNSRLSLQEEPYPRVLSPVSGLAENLSHLSTRSPTPPQPSAVALHLCSASHAVKLHKAARIRGDEEDKENHENVIRSPKPVSPSRKTFPRTIETMVDEEEEELLESPRTRRSSVNMLYNSDDTDQLRRLLQPVEVASKLHTSLPELPVLDCPSPASIETTNIVLKRLPSRTRGRSSTGPRIRPGEQKKQHKSLQERIVKSRPSSPALSPCTSPSVAPRMLSPAMSSNGNLRQRRVIPSLIPTLQIPTCPGSDEPTRRKNTLTKSPRTSPRSSLMINSSDVLLEASPKRTAWTKRHTLLRSEGALPISNMPAFPFDPKNIDKKTLNSNTDNAPNNMAVPFVFNARKDTWIKSQLGSLQGEFDKEFLTAASASQSDGELAEDELKGIEQEGEEEEDEDSGPIRRSVSEMDISMAMANQRKRKFSKRCHGSTMTSSFQSHCEQVRAEQSCKIPTIVSSKHPDLDVIEATTLVRMLQGEFSEHFSQIFIIDCRFPYEYDGGHVVGAVNLHTPQHIESAFPVSMCSDQNENEKKPAIIFHCEFSSERGPKQYRHLRKLDREVNYNVYPKLYYPHLFLLSGGYKEFFLTTKGEMCEPKDYVEMRDVRFSEEMKKHSAEQKKRCLKKFRSQSYSCLLTYMGGGGGGGKN